MLKLALIDECSYPCIQCMYSFIGQLMKITSYLIPEVPEMLIFLDTGLFGVEGMDGDALVLRGDCIKIKESGWLGSLLPGTSSSSGANHAWTGLLCLALCSRL